MAKCGGAPLYAGGARLYSRGARLYSGGAQLYAKGAWLYVEDHGYMMQLLKWPLINGLPGINIRINVIFIMIKSIIYPSQ